jgi:hypothetical protein
VQSPRRCDAREGGSWRRARREEDGGSRGTRATMGGNSVFMGQITQIGSRRSSKPPLLVLPDKGVHAEVPPDYNWEAPRRAPLV